MSRRPSLINSINKADINYKITRNLGEGIFSKNANSFINR
jgi:hypothetical protein